MFEFLQKEMRKPTVKTIEEMIDQNYTFYMTLHFKQKYDSIDFLKGYKYVSLCRFPNNLTFDFSQSEHC